MFKFLVVLLLAIIAIKACSADINVVTAHIPMTNQSYVYYNVNGHRDVISVSAKLPNAHWSW